MATKIVRRIKTVSGTGYSVVGPEYAGKLAIVLDWTGNLGQMFGEFNFFVCYHYSASVSVIHIQLFKPMFLTLLNTS